MAPTIQDIGHFDLSSERLPPLPEQGSLRFGDLPVPVHYYFNYDDPLDDDVTAAHPAQYMLTGDQFSVLVVVHKSVPPSYREIVLFHELLEAELVFANRCPSQIAHRLARAGETMYAKRILTEGEFFAYQAWRATVLDDSLSLREMCLKGGGHEHRG